jgi:hypothetical protein
VTIVLAAVDPLAERAEGSGIDPNTGEQALPTVETEGAYPVERPDPEVGETWSRRRQRLT